MKKYIVFLLICLFLGSCSGSKKSRQADLKGIDFDVTIERFDKDFWALKESKNQKEDLQKLFQKYSEFAPIYFDKIVNFGDNIDTILLVLPKFFADTAVNHLYSDVLKKFINISAIEKNVTMAFRRGHYFFPKLPVPKCIMHVSGLNQSIVVGDYFIAISTDNYLGENYNLYNQLGIYNYVAQNMKSEKIAPDYIFAWLSVEFPYMVEKQRLLDEMIYRGKILYLMSILMPDEKGEILMGYTKKQWQWCKDNEKNMWQTLITEKHLFGSEHSLVLKYLDDAPFTQPFTQESPGRAGQFIGWQIVKSYMIKNQNVTPLQLMQNTNAQQILEKSGYNP